MEIPDRDKYVRYGFIFNEFFLFFAVVLRKIVAFPWLNWSRVQMIIIDLLLFNEDIRWENTTWRLRFEVQFNLLYT